MLGAKSDVPLVLSPRALEDWFTELFHGRPTWIGFVRSVGVEINVAELEPIR